MSTEQKAMKFRKKPVEIEAWQFTEELALRNLIEKEPLPFGLKVTTADYHPGDRKLYRAHIGIETLEGRMRADIGDWIIRGIAGELYPCKPDIFEATYEPSSA